MLSDEQIERYSRQIILRQVGGKGQEKLLRSRVFVDMVGAMQISTLHYLAAVGVGTLGVFSTPQNPQLTSLASSQEDDSFQVIPRLNPDCAISPQLRKENKTDRQLLVRNYDVILADSDFLHEASYQEKKPFLYATATASEAWLIRCQGYDPNYPCLRCIFPRIPTPLLSSPLAETVALFLGAHLATEAVIHLLAVTSSKAHALRFRFLDFHCSTEIVNKIATCPLCSSSHR